MPKIMFDDSFSRLEKTILSKTFKANTEYLGIHNKDFEVRVSGGHFGRPTQYARVAHPKPDLYHIEINRNGFNLFDASSSLGHETIHIKQYTEGHLVDDYDRQGTSWKNNFLPFIIVRLMGNDVPWEKEAWGLQGKVHKHAVASLAQEHRKLIDPKQSHGLNKLWDDNYKPWED
jgi:hypothetical protein